jgi:hypothetical protein
MFFSFFFSASFFFPLKFSLITIPKGSQRDVVYLGWPIAPSYMSPNAGGGGCVVSANQNSCVHHVTWSSNKLQRSNSIFNLWLFLSGVYWCLLFLPIDLTTWSTRGWERRTGPTRPGLPWTPPSWHARQCCQLFSTFSGQNGQKFRPLSKNKKFGSFYKNIILSK